MGGLGATEIIIIVGILVLFFGARKIPELARGIGEGMTEFKKATQNELDENHKDSDTTEQSDSVESRK